jgi:uncharacterized NAD-dependent epimerase/dehydratase family protein
LPRSPDEDTRGAGTSGVASATPLPAVVLANGHFKDSFAKTAHGLVRGSRRFQVVAVVDPSCAGADAGELLDGQRRSIPIFASLAEAAARATPAPRACVIGVATEGGVLPKELREELLRAADLGLQLVNGLHQLLAEDAELAERCRASGAEILDIRRPRPFSELAFWSGRIRQLEIPRIALLGTDCALGKRTTAGLLLEALRGRGIRSDLVYTGQTGWLQGYEHGFLFDATPNDFVSGELERAVLECAAATHPQLILLEGQSSLRNPSGPCGAEFLLSAGARHVVLVHAPAREVFDGSEELPGGGWPIPPLSEELELIRLYGAETLAIALNTARLDAEATARHRAAIERETGLPTFVPVDESLDGLVDRIALRVLRKRS